MARWNMVFFIATRTLESMSDSWMQTGLEISMTESPHQGIYVFQISGVTWRSKKQGYVALSTAEAEYAAQESVQLR